MSETATISLHEAARSLGASIRVVRRAIRAGKLPAPPQVGATALVPREWLARAKAAAEATPGILGNAAPQKAPPFARYEGTSAWRKYRNRVREYESYKASP